MFYLLIGIVIVPNNGRGMFCMKNNYLFSLRILKKYYLR